MSSGICCGSLSLFKYGYSFFRIQCGRGKKPGRKKKWEDCNEFE